jgi:pyridoxal phosphate enzyme (YggS family)
MTLELAEIKARSSKLLHTLPEGVTLIAVTKYATPEMMRWAYAGGIRHFGENRVQDAKSKQELLSDLQDVTWHFIGHLQSNKTRTALQMFDWIHSIDRLSLAEQINDLLPKLDRPRHFCLQVRMAEDQDKSGWYPHQLNQDLTKLQQLTHLSIEGLMTILPLGTRGEQALTLFRGLKELAQELQPIFPQLHHLSMGMSGDYPEALKAGATMIRVGSYLFQ